jgi:hypothetical protein
MKDSNESIMQRLSPADRVRVKRNLKLGKAKENSSFYRKIKELTKNNGLLPETKIEVERLESGGCGADEIVNVEFRVPRRVTEFTDKASGRVEVGSAGPRFSYTFTARRSLEDNMREFHEFFEKRSRAVTGIATTKKHKEISPGAQARKEAGR